MRRNVKKLTEKEYGEECEQHSDIKIRHHLDVSFIINLWIARLSMNNCQLIRICS